MLNTIIERSALVADLRRRVADESQRAAQLQIENIALKNEIDRMREDLRSALDHERAAYQMLVNVDYQVKYGFAPFPDAPKLPQGSSNKMKGGSLDEPEQIDMLMRKKREEAAEELRAAIFGEDIMDSMEVPEEVMFS